MRGLIELLNRLQSDSVNSLCLSTVMHTINKSVKPGYTIFKPLPSFENTRAGTLLH